MMVHPAAVPNAANHRIKTNRLDSQKLVEQSKSGQLRGIRVPSDAYRQLRHFAGLRQQYAQDQRVGYPFLCHVRDRCDKFCPDCRGLACFFLPHCPCGCGRALFKSFTLSIDTGLAIRNRRKFWGYFYFLSLGPSDRGKHCLCLRADALGSCFDPELFRLKIILPG